MICSKCNETIEKYNVLIYRGKLYCRKCKPKKQEMAEDRLLEKEIKPQKTKPKEKEIIRKRLNRKK